MASNGATDNPSLNDEKTSASAIWFSSTTPVPYPNNLTWSSRLSCLISCKSSLSGELVHILGIWYLGFPARIAAVTLQYFWINWEWWTWFWTCSWTKLKHIMVIYRCGVRRNDGSVMVGLVAQLAPEYSIQKNVSSFHRLVMAHASNWESDKAQHRHKHPISRRGNVMGSTHRR